MLSLFDFIFGLTTLFNHPFYETGGGGAGGRRCVPPPPPHMTPPTDVVSVFSQSVFSPSLRCHVSDSPSAAAAAAAAAVGRTRVSVRAAAAGAAHRWFPLRLHPEPDPTAGLPGAAVRRGQGGLHHTGLSVSVLSQLLHSDDR